MQQYLLLVKNKTLDDRKYKEERLILLQIDKTGKVERSTAPRITKVDDGDVDIDDAPEHHVNGDGATSRGLVSDQKRLLKQNGTTNGGSDEILSQVDQEQLDQLLTEKDDKKNSHPWNFFNNQAFKSESLVFEEEFYGENWKTLLTKQMAKTASETVKLNIVENIETYEPRLVSEEIAQTIEVEREEFLQNQKESAEELSIFSVPEQKGFERFKKLFGTIEDEGEIENNFQKFGYPAFDVKGCQKHRNAIELFSYAHKYFIVTKSFSHAIGNTRLTMTIWKFQPSDEDTRGSVERLQIIEWPIVDQSACFDPSMVSIIQWSQYLYYFKVENMMNELNAKSDISFQLYRFDMAEETESLVREMHFNWGKQVVEDDDHKSFDSRTPSQRGSTSNVSQFINEKLNAYCAIFIKADTQVCDNEEDFIKRCMVALVFEGGKGSRDQTFIFKIRRLNHFNQDLFFYHQPIDCNLHFKFQYFTEESPLKKQALVMIKHDRMLVMPIQLSEGAEVTQKEFYHYEGNDCKCCTEAKRELATQLHNQYLDNFKILDSYNYGWGEEYREMNILKKDMVTDMINYLEKDDQIKTNLCRDSLQMVFDKRKYRFILMFNIQHGEYKDDLIIYESSPMNNCRNTLKYNPDELHPLVKYMFHDRELFLQEKGISGRECFIQKQVFAYYNNVIAELRQDDDGLRQIIVAFEEPETDEQEKTMHISIDEAQMFINVFKNIHPELKIQFLQLAKDDRTILPRVVKDFERGQIMFQLFEYRDKTKEAKEEEMVEVEEEGSGAEEEEESEKEVDIIARKKKEEERERVKIEIPLDLSTMKTNMEQIQTFIQPCTSVYRQQFGQEGHEVVQDFQVCVYQKGCQMCRIFQYRVFWELKKKSEREDGKEPYNVRASLVGMKLLILKPTESKEAIGFFPLMDEYFKIYGTQLIFKKKFVINMPNFERDEWMFATEIAMSGYKVYFNLDDLEEECLLVQANIAEVLNIREEFNEADHTMLLKYHVRYVMNMVPFMLDQFLMYELNYSNFLQPLELLNGQNCCDIMLHDPAYLQKVLKQVQTTPRHQRSVFEFFIKELDDEQKAALFDEDFYLPVQVEVSRDPVSMNPLLRCFQAEPILYGSLERILAYMFNRPYSKNQSMIFMEVMPHMLSQSQPSNEFAKFFIDSPNAELNFGKVGSRFTIILNHPDLPQYTNKRITIFEFEDELSVGTQTDVQQWMTDFIINQKSLKKNSQIPVRHYYVDFRIQNLGKKLMQFRRGEDIDTSTISDFEVSQQLYQICNIYGKDIEFQDGVRNIIDDSYNHISYIYTIQFLIFLFGYALPMILAVFVFESPNLVLACNIISLMTMVLFFCYSLIQVLSQGKQFFKQSGNINDILIFVFFAIYLGIRFKDSRNYLPEYVMRDGGLDTLDQEEVAVDEGVRRLAKAGGGGGGGRGGTTGSSSSIYGESTAPPPASFEGSYLADYVSTESRQTWRMAFLGFLHMVLLVTGSIKIVLFLKIYDGFQELVLVLQSCLIKISPFSILIYFWILIVSLMFRILGADNADTVVPEGEEYEERYKLYGSFFHYTFNAYRQALGDPQPIDYVFWTQASEEHIHAARFMSGLIWLLWIVNQYMILIFALNFMVSIITQSYEESLNQSTVVRYTFRCERVMEASILTKFVNAARTLQTFSLSTNNSTHLDKWPGFVQSIKGYVRTENIALRQALSDSVSNLNTKIDAKTKGLEVQITDLSKKLNYVNETVNEKLDLMAEKFEEIKDIIRAQIEAGSEINMDDIDIEEVDSNKDA